eukprot:m.651422 g.651422  ORF g.651422 m.651422 type:complete len:385 (-) comp22676_c0_seq5:797-1951(-)
MDSSTTSEPGTLYSVHKTEHIEDKASRAPRHTSTRAKSSPTKQRNSRPASAKASTSSASGGNARRPKSARSCRRPVSSPVSKEHRLRRPSLAKSRVSPPANGARRERALSQIASLNKGFSVDFDYALLPKCEEYPSRLQLNFAVPKHKLTAANDGTPTRRVCFVSPAKLERAFQLSSLYIGRWGANPRGTEALLDSRSRYQGFLRFLCAKKPILVSTVTLDGDTIRFVDGKHRFCVYRDLGLSCIPVLVPAREQKTFRKRFRPPTCEKAIVKRCTKKVTLAQAKFDPKYNNWRSGNGMRPAPPETATHRRMKTSTESDIQHAAERSSLPPDHTGATVKVSCADDNEVVPVLLACSDGELSSSSSEEDCDEDASISHHLHLDAVS